MAGILLALQVNNWNEYRKDRNFERKMLSEMVITLSNDSSYMNNLITRLERSNQSIQILLEKPAYHDSLGRHFSQVFNGIQFQVNSAPFDVLENKGLDIISNDAIRRQATALYSFYYPRQEKIIEKDLSNFIVNVLEPYFRPRFSSVLQEGGQGEVRFEPNDYTSLVADREYRSLLAQKYGINYEIMGRLKSQLPWVSRLIHEIKNELGK
jgi:hypothetical protein